ncbi:MAG TPA: hypothetical protein VFT22_28930 [Kofleriaceae bacterium]|nr:hypothetical protein [Kofleriaceae bacterium]
MHAQLDQVEPASTSSKVAVQRADAVIFIGVPPDNAYLEDRVR